MKQVSIIVPAFNEEGNIKGTIKSICDYVDACELINSYELIVINDGSHDGTASEVLTECETFTHVKLINHPINLGRGAALKTGITASRGNIVIALDADLSYEVHHISRIITAFNNNEKLGAVIVSPYMKGGVVKNIPISRLLLSRCANWLLSGYFDQNISTVTSMVRGYRGSVIRSLPLLYNSKELHLEILRKLYLLGIEIKEVPGELVWKEKKNRATRLNKRTVVTSAKKHLLYSFLSKPTRFIALFAALVFLVGVYEFLIISYQTILNFQFVDESFARSLWLSLSSVYNQSPHTVIIFTFSIIFSIQLITFVGTLLTLKTQHEETMQHLLHLMKEKS